MAYEPEATNDSVETKLVRLRGLLKQQAPAVMRCLGNDAILEPPNLLVSPKSSNFAPEKRTIGLARIWNFIG